MFRLLKFHVVVAFFATVNQVVLGYSLPVQNRGIEQHHAGNKKGAVASESAVCSQIGVDLISKGGNAADAVG